MFLFVLAKLLPERHNLYGNSLDFKLKYMREKKIVYKKLSHWTFSSVRSSFKQSGGEEEG